jgi:hypothetical protein
MLILQGVPIFGPSFSITPYYYTVWKLKQTSLFLLIRIDIAFTMTAQDQQTAEEGEMASQDEQWNEYRMDGGLQAWLQVLGSWILFANTWFVVPSIFGFELLDN